MKDIFNKWKLYTQINKDINKEIKQNIMDGDNSFNERKDEVEYYNEHRYDLKEFGEYFNDYEEDEDYYDNIYN